MFFLSSLQASIVFGRMKCQKCSSVRDLVGVNCCFCFFFLSYMSLVFTYNTDQPESQIQTKVLQQKQKKFVSTTRKTSLSCYHGTFQRAATSASLFLPCLLRKVPVLTEAFECHCNICLLLRMKGIRKNVIVIKLPDIQLQTTTAFK